MTDTVPHRHGIPPHVREAAGKALRQVYQGVESGPGPAIPWDQLRAERREVWRDRADQVVLAALAALDEQPLTEQPEGDPS